MRNKNHLYIRKFNIVELAKKFDTPLYVYDGEKIKMNYQKIFSVIPYKYKQIHYAIMCNDRVNILKILLKSGSYLQVNSLKEYLLARKAGFSNEKISVTTTNISEYDMNEFIKNKVKLNLDSIEEVERYGQIIEKFRRRKKTINDKIGIRIFVHVKATGQYVTNTPYKPKARVGIKKEKFEQLQKITEKYKLKIVGVHGYVASNILDLKPFLKLNQYLFECSKNFLDLEYINFGAGFGLPLNPKDKKFDWISYGKHITSLMILASNYFGRKIDLKIEPGRSVVGDVGILITKVTNIKNMDSWKEIGADSGFGIFARPYIYGWNKGGYHPIIVANKINEKPIKLYTICSNSVLQGDYLAEDRKLPKVEIGDLVAILKVGAYGATMMSLFPGMKKPKEILILKDKVKVVRC